MGPCQFDALLLPCFSTSLYSVWVKMTMKRLRNHLIGIDQGETILFSDFQNDGEMWTGQGARQVRMPISFSERFRSSPTVITHLAMWDVDNATNMRVDIQPEDITDEGFVIVFRTWGDTRIARVRVAWIAMGELRHGDDFELY